MRLRPRFCAAVGRGRSSGPRPPTPQLRPLPPSQPVSRPPPLPTPHSAVPSCRAMAWATGGPGPAPCFKVSCLATSLHLRRPPGGAGMAPRARPLDFHTVARASGGQGPDPLRVAPRGLLRRGEGTRTRRRGTEGLEAEAGVACLQPRDAQDARSLRRLQDARALRPRGLAGVPPGCPQLVNPASHAATSRGALCKREDRFTEAASRRRVSASHCHRDFTCKVPTL